MVGYDFEVARFSSCSGLDLLENVFGVDMPDYLFTRSELLQKRLYQMIGSRPSKLAQGHVIVSVGGLIVPLQIGGGLLDGFQHPERAFGKPCVEGYYLSRVLDQVDEFILDPGLISQLR